jgi:enterochelin esterase-like enzyme
VNFLNPVEKLSMGTLKKYLINQEQHLLTEVDMSYELSSQDKISGDRIIYIHVPQLPITHPLGIFIFLDGQNEINSEHLEIESTPLILDKLYTNKDLTYLYLSVYIPSSTTLSERISEYSCNANFANFISQNLIPLLQKPKALGGQFECSTDRNLIAIGGVSLGGLSATYTALRHPELFSTVLAQSASFWWYDDWIFGSDVNPRLELLEWLENQEFPNSHHTLNFYLHASKTELGFEGYPRFVDLNQLFAKKISAKGHQVDIAETDRGEHDYPLWQSHKPIAFKKIGTDTMTRMNSKENSATHATNSNVLFKIVPTTKQQVSQAVPTFDL